MNNNIVNTTLHYSAAVSIRARGRPSPNGQSECRIQWRSTDGSTIACGLSNQTWGNSHLIGGFWAAMGLGLRTYSWLHTPRCDRSKITIIRIIYSEARCRRGRHCVETRGRGLNKYLLYNVTYCNYYFRYLIYFI